MINIKVLFIMASRAGALKKLMAMSLVLLLLSFSIFVFYYQPVSNHYSQLQTHVKDLRTQLLSLRNMSSSAADLQALRINVNKLSDKLNFSTDLLTLSKHIHELSKQSGAQIIRQTNHTQQQDENNPRTVFKQILDLEGSYGQLKQFIYGIYDLPSMTLIQESVIEKKAGHTRQLKASLVLISYQTTGIE